MTPHRGSAPRRRSPPVPGSGRNYDCDSPCTSPPFLHASMPLAGEACQDFAGYLLVTKAAGRDRRARQPEKHLLARQFSFHLNVIPRPDIMLAGRPL